MFIIYIVTIFKISKYYGTSGKQQNRHNDSKGSSLKSSFTDRDVFRVFYA